MEPGRQQLYYCVNGVVRQGGVYKIDGDLYGFDENGAMYENVTFTSADQNGRGSYTYHALAGGKLAKNMSWKASNGDQYYFDADGKGYEGSHKVNGVTYYFESGRLLKNAAATDSDGKMFILDSKGKKHSMANNKWVKVDGYYYYAMDGTVQKNTIILINGKYYAFDENGRMYDNRTFSLNGITYHATVGGALMVKQQYKSGKDTYYFDLYGRGYEGVHYIAGKHYVFSGGKIVR